MTLSDSVFVNPPANSWWWVPSSKSFPFSRPSHMPFPPLFDFSLHLLLLSPGILSTFPGFTHTYTYGAGGGVRCVPYLPILSKFNRFPSHFNFLYSWIKFYLYRLISIQVSMVAHFIFFFLCLKKNINLPPTSGKIIKWAEHLGTDISHGQCSVLTYLDVWH